MHHDSDATPLDELPRVRIPKPWRRRVETCMVIGSLFLGGFGTGFVFASRNAETAIAHQREDHLHELERLTKAYDNRLSSLSGRVNEAADTAASAAATAGEAATTAQSAAQTANKAVNSVTKDGRKP